MKDILTEISEVVVSLCKYASLVRSESPPTLATILGSTYTLAVPKDIQKLSPHDQTPIWPEIISLRDALINNAEQITAIIRYVFTRILSAATPSEDHTHLSLIRDEVISGLEYVLVPLRHLEATLVLTGILFKPFGSNVEEPLLLSGAEVAALVRDLVQDFDRLLSVDTTRSRGGGLAGAADPDIPPATPDDPNTPPYAKTARRIFLKVMSARHMTLNRRNSATRIGGPNEPSSAPPSLPRRQKQTPDLHHLNETGTAFIKSMFTFLDAIATAETTAMYIRARFPAPPRKALHVMPLVRVVEEQLHGGWSSTEEEGGEQSGRDTSQGRAYDHDATLVNPKPTTNAPRKPKGKERDARKEMRTSGNESSDSDSVPYSSAKEDDDVLESEREGRKKGVEPLTMRRVPDASQGVTLQRTVSVKRGRPRTFTLPSYEPSPLSKRLSQGFVVSFRARSGIRMVEK
ncbi:hypothetical protein HK097_010376 [Rhizophlyctis rosea]|uniref:Uncharacterized protein n=1 Tax=Rhizophlyctis rosea TaxID=64517 RepID=A0AAD5S987_9FUNG|nr:hypothetical protein HK097_010376 [Rhizophlyctis rosea]